MRIPIRSRLLKGALAAALTAGLACALPAVALADETNALEGITFTYGVHSFDYIESKADTSTTLSTQATLPETFDLRDKGVVTGVKLQNPFGTCWAFAPIAASEISINSMMGFTTTAKHVDLSEHHLSWFAKGHIPIKGEEGYDASNSQTGEGMYKEGNPQQMDGGNAYLATNAMASGIGPVLESANTLFEYHGKNSTKEDEYNYSADDDWSIPYAYRNASSYELKEGTVLPANYDALGNFSEASVTAVKNQLYAGRGVEVLYHADTAQPEDLGNLDSAQYINTKTWAHYTYSTKDEEGNDVTPKADHAVCIVGWDDNYSKENFLSEVQVLDENGEPTGETKKVEQPAGDGAWIVKNSWGANSQTFPNKYDWGNDGYFYLSYYDKSLSTLEAFEFYKTKTGYTIDQYDTLPAEGAANGFMDVGIDTNPMYMANVFTADPAKSLRSISCYTTLENTKVSYKIVLLDDDGKIANGTTVASGTRSYANGGFHRIDLPKAVKFAGHKKYAVVETVSVDAGGAMYYMCFPYAYGKESAKESAADKENYLYPKAVVNKGESFLGRTVNGKLTWTDWATIQEYPQMKASVNVNDNFAIKAYLDNNGDNIKKATNPASVKKAQLTKKVKAKKKKKAYSTKIKVTKAKGKVVFSKAKTAKAKKLSGYKRLTVTKTGKIVVPKKMKKGTYRLRVKIRVAGNSMYKAKTMYRTIKVVVR